MGKQKLTIDEQIHDLKEKGVMFSIMSEENAKKFLRYNNYYFKIKAYARNYPINPKNGKYVNLEFEYLVELSKIDTYLRKMILNMCLDVEHILKTRLLYDVSINPKEDGYQIASKFLRFNESAHQEIQRMASSYCFTSDLADKHIVDETYSIWNLVELLSFGKFIDLYKLYYQEYQSPNYGDYLESIKFLQNAAAHNNCLLSSMGKPKGKKKFHKTKQLANALANAKERPSANARAKYLAYPSFHDFVALLFVYNDLLKTGNNRQMRDRTMRELIAFLCDKEGRALKHKEYFSKNQVITEAYRFIVDVVHYVDAQNHNPKHKGFLKI